MEDLLFLHIFRFLPTALIGLYLTFIVYKTGSIYLSIIGHSINNSLAIMITSYPDFGKYFGWLTAEEPFSLIVIMIIILLISSGVYLIFLSSRRNMQVLTEGTGVWIFIANNSLQSAAKLRLEAEINIQRFIYRGLTPH